MNCSNICVEYLLRQYSICLADTFSQQQGLPTATRVLTVAPATRRHQVPLGAHGSLGDSAVTTKSERNFHKRIRASCYTLFVTRCLLQRPYWCALAPTAATPRREATGGDVYLSLAQMFVSFPPPAPPLPVLRQTRGAEPGGQHAQIAHYKDHRFSVMRILFLPSCVRRRVRMEERQQHL